MLIQLALLTVVDLLIPLMFETKLVTLYKHIFNIKNN